MHTMLGMLATWSTPVHTYMSERVVSVKPDETLANVEAICQEKDLSALPVVDGAGVLCGIISTTDLLRVAHYEATVDGTIGKMVVPPARLVHEVMTKNVVTVNHMAPLFDAASKMIEHRIHRVVVTQYEKAVGVFSTRDAMRAVMFHRAALPLSKALTAPVSTIDVGAPIDAAVAQLKEANVHGLVVVDGEWPVGVFTHTEAIKAKSLPPNLLSTTPVEEVMSYETICLNVSTPLYKVAEEAIKSKVRRILAVDHRKLVGIITGFDLVRWMIESVQATESTEVTATVTPQDLPSGSTA